MQWQTARFQIDLTRPQVMGIVNVTPDSFSDGGRFACAETALRHCERLLEEGADLLDIGAESSRPGATPLPLADELARLLPVLREAVKLGVPISVDSYKPQVMQAVLDLGADIINDIWSLRWQPEQGAPDGQQVIARHPSCGVCLMHMHGAPLTMQVTPMTGDVVPQVLLFWKRVTQELLALGVQSDRMVVDPGIGFGKTVAQNFALLARQRELLAAGFPLLLGWSRKSSLAAVAGTPLTSTRSACAAERLAPSIAAAMLAVQRGARIVRVHDVGATVQALKILNAIQ